MHCTLFGEDNGKQGRQICLRLECSNAEVVSAYRIVIIKRGRNGTVSLGGLVVARAGVWRIYVHMPNSRTKASTCFAAAVLPRNSGHEKIYTKTFDCVFQTSSRLCEFGTNFNKVFYCFWYFTLVAEPVRMKTNT